MRAYSWSIAWFTIYTEIVDWEVIQIVTFYAACKHRIRHAMQINKYFKLKLVGLPPQLEILAPFGRSSVTHNR